MNDDTLPHGWTAKSVERMAWRAARMHPTSVLSPSDRADVASYGILLCLYEHDDEPDTHEVFNSAVGAISTAASKELREHGYSTRTGEPMHAYGAFWLGLRAAPDALEDRIVERIAVWQIVAALPGYQRRALWALAQEGNYAAAAQSLGVSYNSIRIYLSDARATCRELWNYPDPPGPHWGQDKPTLGHGRKARAMDAIRDRARRRRKESTAALPTCPALPPGAHPPRGGNMPDRIPRCRLLGRLGNRCTNPEVGGTGLCAHHLAQAHNDYITIMEALTV